MTVSYATTDGDTARCFVAIEISKKSWLVAVLTPLSDKIGLNTLPTGDGAALLQLLERVRRRMATALGRRVEMVSCLLGGL